MNTQPEQAKNKKPYYGKKNNGTRKPFQPKRKGDNHNLVDPNHPRVRNEPNYQPSSVETIEFKEFMEQRERQKAKLDSKKQEKPIVDEEVKVEQKLQVPKPKKGSDVRNEIQTFPIDRKFYEEQAMFSESGCRGKISLDGDLVRKMMIAYSDYIQKHNRLSIDSDYSLFFEAAVTLGVCGQIIATQPRDVQNDSGLKKLTSMDFHLPEYLCGIIKTVGNFDCSFGRFELSCPIATCLAYLQKLYAKVDPEHDIPVFKNLAANTVLVPWHRETFQRIKKHVAQLLELEGGTLFGYSVNLPLPDRASKVRKADFNKIITYWPEKLSDNIITLCSYLFLEETGFVEQIECGNTIYRFVNSEMMRKIKSWCSLLAADYRENVQADVLKILKCDKFVVGPSGQPCQFVKRDGNVISSPFMIGKKDAAYGAIYSYQTKFELVGDFSGYTALDMQTEMTRIIQDSMVRTEII